MRVAILQDVTLVDAALHGDREVVDPALMQRCLQPLDPADGLNQMQSRPGDVLADVAHRQLIREVDQRLQAGQLPCQQIVDRRVRSRDLIVDDRQRQRMLRAEVKIHGALGQFGFGEHIVEADLVVGKPGELACGGAQDLLARGIGSGVGRLGHGWPPSDAPRRAGLTTDP